MEDTSQPTERALLLQLIARTYSHIDGRDLLAELHPRKTLDIKRRVDGVETWYEGDWLTSLQEARDAALAVLAGQPVPPYLRHGPQRRQIDAVTDRIMGPLP